MKIYDDKHIKNIVLLGAPKSGKTTLAEDMAFEAGIIHRRGTVEAGTTVSDYQEIEKAKGHSIFATTLHTEWQDYKINIIDAPGYDDFSGEMISSLRVADTCVMVINAQHGVEVGAELVWNYIKEFNKPVIFDINQVDHPKSDFFGAVDSLRLHFGSAVTIMQYPLQEGEGFHGIIDLLKMTYYRFNQDGGKPEKLQIPAEEQERAGRLHNVLVEKAAENDEQLLEQYLQKGTLDEAELRAGLRIGMVQHDVFPVFVTSARKNMGSGRLMGFIDHVAPSPMEAKPERTLEGHEIPYDPAGPVVLFVYKTHLEPSLGKISYFKVLSGTVTPNIELVNANKGSSERLHQLFIVDGKSRNPVEKLVAGDLGATLKLKETSTNHTLHAKEFPVEIQPVAYPSPRIQTAVVATNKNDSEKIGEVLHKIHEEDPTMEVYYSQEIKQLLLTAQGETHLAVCKWYLENVYKLTVEFITPRISYRETIRKPAEGFYRHRKQSGGAGQFAEVYLKIDPYVEGMPEPDEFPVRGKEEINLPWGGKLIFYNCIVGGVIDQRFIPAIQKGILEKMEAGPITGSHVRDVRVQVYDGKMHAVDSNDLSFRLAAIQAFRTAFMDAEPLLLEPVMDMEIWVPDEMMGDVLGDLQTRRSLILGVEANGNFQTIKTRTPLAELDRYTTSLRSMTQGRGKFSQRFAEYVPVPVEIQRQIARTMHEPELV